MTRRGGCYGRLRGPPEAVTWHLECWVGAPTILMTFVAVRNGEGEEEGQGQGQVQDKDGQGCISSHGFPANEAARDSSPTSRREDAQDCTMVHRDRHVHLVGAMQHAFRLGLSQIDIGNCQGAARTRGLQDREGCIWCTHTQRRERRVRGEARLRISTMGFMSGMIKRYATRAGLTRDRSCSAGTHTPPMRWHARGVETLKPKP